MNELTVAICAYNCERYIEETLGCIFAQTLQDFDMLIIDDCSTDNTKKLVLSALSKNSRHYKLITFEQNRGIGYARHFAERCAETKYMLFIDADDLPYPELVEKLYKKIKSDSDLIAVGCYLEYVSEEGKTIGGGLFLGDKTKEKFNYRAANKKLFFMPVTAIYDREIALSVGGYCVEGFPEGKPRYQDFCEDLDLWTRMSDLYQHGNAIIIVPEVLYGYRKHGQSISANTLAMFIKMRYVKVNLLRRRAGQKELSFTDFYQALSSEELESFAKDAEAASTLRCGIFNLKKWKILSGITSIVQAAWINPKYCWQKIKSNSGIFR